jgi:glycosyltransferase involved in cell wall biosynthesis
MPEKHYNILWDGYGLHNPRSGVYRHVQALQPFFVGSNNFKITPNAVRFKPWAAFRLGQFIKDIRLDYPLIVHGFSNINLPIFHPNLKQNPNLRFVLTVHDLIPLLGGVSFSSYLQFKMMFGLATRYADKIVCVSEWTRRSLIDFDKSLEQKIVVIANGFQPEEIHLSPPPEKKPIIDVLNIARYEKYKNFDLLMAIASKDQIRLNLVTDKIGQRYVNTQYQRLIQNKKINLYADLDREALSKLYLNCDVYISTSRWEGFCLPALEALCFHKPIAFLGGSGIDELLDTDTSQKLNPESSSDEWLKAITLLRDSHSHHPQREEWFSRNLLRHKSWKDRAEELKCLYSSLI